MSEMAKRIAFVFGVGTAAVGLCLMAAAVGDARVERSLERRWFSITREGQPPIRVCGLRVERKGGCVIVVDWDQIAIADVCGSPQPAVAAEGLCVLEAAK